VIAALQIGTPRSESAGFTLGIRLVDWWCTQAQIFVMYLKLAVWPLPLVIHYALPHLESFATVWPFVAAVAVLALIAFVLLARRRPAGWLLSSVFLILAPTHLVPIATEIAAERRMYLPLAALVALAVVGGYWLVTRLALRANQNQSLRIVGALTLLVAVAYVAVATSRVAVFHDPVALWQSNVDLQPYNHVAQANLATALSASGGQKDAIAHYREALRAKPEFDEGRYRLGLALAAAGELDESIAELRIVVEHQPNAFKIRNNLGVVLFTAGRFQEAIAEFEKVLEMEPNLADARENLNRAREASVLPKQPE
jgi:tetratricopeptide (TPR) repeat protein